MAIYRYQHGDRPLEGYTIQHALGRGGFGEVYYAISDSGREVALKAVQNYGDVELRGIKHCMNLKNPHLVSIFDIKHNEQNLPFVLMEYVDGPSLRDILDAHPEGLGPAKAAFFLREIVKGLSYLHECGVVHRDLKPHNVFYEQGVVKIGDYSLSKAISASHRTGHTVTVGTVHYMAPEISLGRYDHTVDIYALGVLLYEMLTGLPPFVGDTMGEVLMKHMAGQVDLSGIEAPFAQVIEKALRKEPRDRFQSAEDMVAQLMGNKALEHSVAALGPETLTIVAERAMRSQEAASMKASDADPQPTAAYYEADRAKQARRKQTPGAFDTPHAIMGKWLLETERHPFLWGLAAVAVFLLLVSIRGGRGPLPGPWLLAIGVGIAAVAAFKHRRRRLDEETRPSRVHDAQPIRSGPNPYGPPSANPGSHARHRHVHQPKYVAEPIGPTFPNIDASPYSRLVSLVMSGLFFFVPVAGLQRFYVGRIKSGLLWLLTFGLLGIGQVYDTIMIAVGQFKDVDGRRVLDFSKEPVAKLSEPVNQYSSMVRRTWTDSRVGFKLGNLFFNLLGAVFLLISLTLGAIVAIDIPRAVAEGAFSQDLAAEIARETQTSDWHLIVSFCLGVITVITGTIAAICLIFARRDSSWGHMLRIPIAAAAFVASVRAFGSTTWFGEQWDGVAMRVRDGMVGEALMFLLQGQFWPGMIMACVFFVIAVFVLAWPAKRKLVEETYHVPNGSAAPAQATANELSPR